MVCPCFRSVFAPAVFAPVFARPETVSRWHKQPEFLAELRRLVELASLGDTRARVEALTHPALDALESVLALPHANTELRVQAAAALLTFAAALGRWEGGEKLPDPGD